MPLSPIHTTPVATPAPDPSALVPLGVEDSDGSKGADGEGVEPGLGNQSIPVASPPSSSPPAHATLREPEQISSSITAADGQQQPRRAPLLH